MKAISLIKITRLAFILYFFLFVTSCTNNNPSNIKATEAKAKEQKLIDPCQILYHADFSYKLCAPEDMFAMEDSTLIGVGQSRILVKYFLKSDSSKIFSESPSNSGMGIYSNVIFKDEYKNLRIDEFVEGEISSAKERGERVFSKTNLLTKTGMTATVKQFLNERRRQYFSIAYIDEPRHIVMVTFTTRTAEQFQTYYLDFEKVVKSYEKSMLGIEQ